MSLLADRTYDGTITGAELMYANSGTPGIQVFIEYGEGEKTSTIWYLTNKTVKNVEKTLTDLGIDAKNLVSESFLDAIGNALAGKEISFTTHNETYKNKSDVKVQWVNPRSKSRVTDNPAKMAAALFAGPEAVSKLYHDRGKKKALAERDAKEAALTPVDDDSIPF